MASIKCGIVGLPNVGKSTLFNALLKKQVALAANYPFATIEPNIGVVEVPDYRLAKLAEVVHSKKIVPAIVEFIDIAGIVAGASEGAGLGNKFLSHIREVSIIAHIVRVFEDENIIKEGAVDPKSDYQTIRTELILADLQTLSKINEKTLKAEPIKAGAIETLKKALDAGQNVYDVVLSDEEKASIRELNLLTNKKEIVVLNVAEGEYKEEKITAVIEQYARLLEIEKDRFVVASAQIESELAELNQEEQKEYLKQLGVETPGLERLIKKAYETLGLISFLTAGEIEARAWTIPVGTKAPQAAGVIHTDFEKKFIKAEIVKYQDFVEAGGWSGAREKGKVTLAGSDYEMKDGDIVDFKIGG